MPSNRFPFLSFALMILAGGLAAYAADDRFDQVDEALSFAALENTFRGKISGTLDLELYRVEQPAPGLISTEGNWLFNPRLSVFFDARWGTKIYGFVQVRADRGYDPNSDTKRFRWDEYALRFRPDGEGRLVVQVGKFATVLGNWIVRHASWENPFIGAPLPYENVTAISDLAAPVSAIRFVSPEADEKYEYNPIVWGSSYGTGLSVSGTSGRFDYAFEVKNSALSSRPEAWSLSKVGFEAPTYTARIGFRPDLRWNLGVSASDGAYHLPVSAASLPTGHGRREYRQKLLAADLGFAWHYLQVWAEFFESTFDVPGIGTPRTRAGYVEAKYKVTPQLYAALRINRQVFSNVDIGLGRVPWSPAIWRIDAAAGYRVTPHAQLKLQVSAEDREASASRRNVAGQFTLRF